MQANRAGQAYRASAPTGQQLLKVGAAILKYLGLTLFALVLLAPLLYAFYVSFELPADYGKFVGPDRLTLWNYEQVFQLVPVGRWYLNTAVVTAIVMLGNFVVNTTAGYALARLNFRGKKLIFMLVLAIMMVPLQAYLIPLYLQVADLKWLNTYLALTVPFLVYTFFIFLMRQSFMTIPKDLEDAAEVDGLGKLGVFFRVALPLSYTAVVTQAILGFTSTWNSFLIPVTMTNNPDVFVLTVGLNTLKSQYYDFPTVTMAGVILLTIPVIVVFVMFQRFIVPSLASSGLKV